MKEFIVMSVLALGVAIVFLVLATLMIVQKRGGRIFVYPTLLLFPFLLIAFPNLFLSYSSKELLGNVFVAVPRVIYSTIILVFIIFVMMKENISPQIGMKHANRPVASKKLIGGMRLLEYSIVANIIYIAPIVLGSLYCVISASHAPQHTPGGSAWDMFASVFVWALILLLPAAQYYAMVVILIIYFGALAILMLITSINGVVRVTTAGEKYSKLTGLFIVLMFIPVVNILFMIVLCFLGNRELKMTGGI